MSSAEPSEKLEVYLQRVRESLRTLPPAETSEIVQELRSHVLDCVAGDLSDASVEATLLKLGDPHEIARVNLCMRRGEESTGQAAPPTVNRTIAQLVGLSARTLVALIISLIGYGFAVCWLFTALLKPFAPNRVGLWLLPDPTGDLSLSLGRHAADAVGQDLLGWWIMPVGLVVGIAMGVLTYRFDLYVIRRMAGQRPSAQGPPT